MHEYLHKAVLYMLVALQIFFKSQHLVDLQILLLLLLLLLHMVMGQGGIKARDRAVHDPNHASIDLGLSY